MQKESRKVHQTMLIAAYQAGRLAAQFDHQTEPHPGVRRATTTPVAGRGEQEPGDRWHH